MRPMARGVVSVLLAATLFGVSGSNSVDAGSQGGGLGHVLLVTPAGAVWAWGYNAEAQLGDNTRISRRIPAAVAGMGTVTAVAAGGSHSLALDSAGRIWAWGDNNLGAVGDGTTVDKLLPTQLALLDVVKIAAGGSHSMALRSNGELYVWGKNTDSQLGLGNTTQQNSPVLLMSGVADIAAGGRHSVIVKTDGTAWAFGYNFNGQLGDGTTTLRSTPVQMSGVSSAVAVAAGSSHTLIRRSDGTLLAAGLNFYGQIGDGTTTQRTTAVSVTGLTNAVEIAAGDNHSFARLSDGTVKAWGANSTGSLGDGTTTMRTSPVTVGLPAVSSVGSGGTFGVATTAAGVVYTWGSNAYGEQGDGTINTHALVPHAISGASFDWNVATPTLNVASGTYFFNQTVTVMNVMTGVSMHYTTTGGEPTQSDATIASGTAINVQTSQVVKVKAWKASLPASDTAVRDYVLKVSTPTISPGGSQYTTPKTVTLSTTTSGASLYYTVDGSTPTTGSTSYSSPITISTGTVLKVLGAKAGWANSAEAPATYTFNFGTLTAPTVDPSAGPFTSGVDVTMASSQSGATVRYTTNGSTPTTSSTVYTGPVAIFTSGTVKAKAFHPDYTASAETSRTYELVTATPTFSLTAGTYAAGTAVVVSTSTPGASISYSTDGSAPTPSHPTLANGDAVIVGNSTLKAMAWKAGQTNSGAASAAYSVTGHLTAPGVSGGGSHTVALRGDGTVFAWGRNAGRELADGTATMRLQPVVSGGVTGATAISVGDGFSLARLVDGRVVGWGGNGFSQLGDGTTTNPRPWPVFATGITSAAAVDAGSSHALALLTDGTVVGWGQNNAGQIGDGSTTGRTVPTPVPGLTNAVAVSAGSGFSLAVTADGTAWSWGGNGNGQLGTGNTTARSTPDTVPGLTNVRAVAAGTFTSYFLMADGTVRAVGSNAGGAGAGGALGNGTSGGQSLTPVTVSGLTNVVQIAAGSAHGLALKSDRTVWAWGNGGTGQIGNGATSDVTTPVQVSGLPAIVAIGAGATHSLALGLDGSVWTWGANSQGQLGDGSQTARLVPVQISMPGTGWTLPTPTLTSLTPTAGAVGTSVTVTGTDFGAAPSTSTLAFNGVAATPSAWSPTSITTTVPTGASNGPVTVTVGGQTSNGLSFTVASPPTLTALSPTVGPVGAAVTLSGTNFGGSQGTSTVSFNGTVATPTGWSATSITAPVPVGATSGPVSVSVDGQTSNGLSFTVIPTPTLTSLSPASGGIGTAVTLTGTNFGATQGSSVVFFNGTAAAPTAWSANSITAPVPASATTGPVTVTVQGQTSNGIGFTLTPAPTLTSLSPTSGGVGSVVTLVGTDFGPSQGSSLVVFNGVEATAAAWSDTSITVQVPNGASSGPVTVIVAGQASNDVSFTVTTTPTVNTVSPSAAAVGVTITLLGSNFGPSQGGSGVTFNGVSAAVSTWSANQLAVVVPPLATNGDVVVTVNGIPSVGLPFTVLDPTAAPVLSPGSGSYAAGQMVTITSATSGATIYYTTSGDDPDLNDFPLANGASVPVGSYTIKARAYTAEAGLSAVSQAAYTRDSSACTYVVRPGALSLGGAGAAGQVTVAPSSEFCDWTASSSQPWLALGAAAGTGSGAFSILASPNTTGALRTASITVGSATIPVVQNVVSTCTFSVAPSAVAAGAAAGSGTIDVTTSDPACAWVAAPDVPWLTLGASSGVGSGSVPYAYTANSGASERWSGVTVANLQVSVTQASGMALTIAGGTTPPANALGWHRDDVTVVFSCAGPGNITCANPVTVTTDGIQDVTGTASNDLSQSASTTVPVRIDRVAPHVSVSFPRANSLIQPGAVTITGSVGDTLSDPVVVCDGALATVTGGTFACTVTVGSGTTNVTIAAVDAAGNQRTVVAVISTTDAIVTEPTNLRVSPQDVTIAVGQRWHFAMLDNLGRAPVDVTWTRTNPTLSTLAIINGQAELTAVATGTTTLTASWRGLTASTTVTIVSANAFVAGTTVWNAPPLGVGATIADVLTGAKTPAGDRFLYAVERSAVDTIRMFDVEGAERWSIGAGGQVTQLSGDALGGAVTLVGSTLTRLEPGGASVPFASDVASPGFAVHPDGPLYYVHWTGTGYRLRGDDVGLGAGRFWDLPMEASGVGTPTVMPDGSVALPYKGPTFRMLIARPDGSTSTYELFSGPQQPAVTPYKAIPNGQGGYFVAYDDWGFNVNYYAATIVTVDSNGVPQTYATVGGTQHAFNSGTWFPTGPGRSHGTLVMGPLSPGGPDVLNVTYNAVKNGQWGVGVTDLTASGFPISNFWLPGVSQPTYLSGADGFVGSYPDGLIWGPSPDYDLLTLTMPRSVSTGMWFGGQPGGALSQLVGPVFRPSDGEWPFAQGGSQATNASDPIIVDNRLGTSPLLVKLENGDNQCGVVAAGRVSRVAVDGVKPDKWRLQGAPEYSGDWYKVKGRGPLKTGIFIKADGEPARFAPTWWMSPVLLFPECDFGGACPAAAYHSLGGRKKEPAWSLPGSHPDWVCQP